MFNDSESYLDYVEIRRRVERRLASGQSVVIHVALFLLALLALVAVFGVPFYSSRFALVNFFMAGWSGLVFLHSVWLYRNGGTDTNRRLSVVQAELDERLDAEDTELLANPRQAFRVQSLLDEDVRLRSGWIPAIAFAALINCFIWGVWMFGNASSGAVWQMVLLLSFVYMPATYAVNQVRRRLRDNKLRGMMAVRPVARSVAKQKRSFDTELERYARLSDDGELMDMPEDWATYDRSKRGIAGQRSLQPGIETQPFPVLGVGLLNVRG